METLRVIFDNKSENRTVEICQALEQIAVTCTRGMKVMDIRELDNSILTASEKKQLFSYISVNLCNEKSLKETLEEVLGVRNPEKIKNMEELFERNEIYTADILVNCGLEIIDEEISFFSEEDASKIRDYIKKAQLLNQLLLRKNDLFQERKDARFELGNIKKSSEYCKALKDRQNPYKHDLLRRVEDLEKKIRDPGLAQVSIQLRKMVQLVKDDQGRLPPVRSLMRRNQLRFYTAGQYVRIVMHCDMESVIYGNKKNWNDKRGH